MQLGRRARQPAGPRQASERPGVHIAAGHNSFRTPSSCSCRYSALVAQFVSFLATNSCIPVAFVAFCVMLVLLICMRSRGAFCTKPLAPTKTSERAGGRGGGRESFRESFMRLNNVCCTEAVGQREREREERDEGCGSNNGRR